jgi:hypothetical protein
MWTVAPERTMGETSVGSRPFVVYRSVAIGVTVVTTTSWADP